MNFFNQIRTLWIALGLLLTMNVAALGWIWISHHGPGRFPLHFKERSHEKQLRKELELNREQEAKLHEIKRSHHEQLRAEKEKISELKFELKELAMSDDTLVDPEPILQELAEAQESIERSNYENLKEAYSSLEPEQRDRFRAMVERKELSKRRIEKGKERKERARMKKERAKERQRRIKEREKKRRK